MTTPAQRNLAARKAIFGVLLVVIALAVGYVIYQNRPWIVPEEAKLVKNPLPPSDATLQAAHAPYLDKCAHCHGEFGKGDGHNASSYVPAPTNFTDAAHMQAITDGELFYKITEGHRPMPSYKKRLTEEQRWQLVLLIRSFAPADGAHDDFVKPAPKPSPR